MADIHIRCDDEMSYLFSKRCKELGVEKSEYIRNCITMLLNIDTTNSDISELKKKAAEFKDRADNYRQMMEKEIAQYQLLLSCINNKQKEAGKTSKAEQEEVEAAAEFMKREGLTNGLY